MSAPLLAVVDIGTGSIRSHVVDADGALVASARRPGQVTVGPDGRAEVEPESIWQAVREGLAEAVAGVDRRRLAALGLASALGYVLLDRAGAPVGPALLWMDRRAVREAEELAARTDHNALYRTTGRRLDPEVFLAKLRWLRRHEPARLARVATFVGLKDDVIRRLTGVIGTDPTHAAYTMLYDVGRRDWAPDLLALGEVAAASLPALRRADEVAGRVTAEAAAATGLPEGLPVVTGTSDGTAACLAAGAAPGLAVNVTGTSDVVMAVSDAPRLDPEARTLLNPHPLGAGWMVGGVLGTTGATLRWLADRLGLAGEDRYRRLDAEAAAVPVGARGLVCLPGLAGERAPRWNPAARGAFVGLDLTHGRAELARAVLEGVALSVRGVVEALGALGTDVRRLRVVGGGAASDLWCQIRADATGLPVERPRSVEGTATAAAVLAGLGVGLYADLGAAMRAVAPAARQFAPATDAAAAYGALAREHDRAHAALAGCFRELGRWRESGR